MKRKNEEEAWFVVCVGSVLGRWFFVCGIDGRPWKKKSVNPSRVSHFQPDLRSRATLVLFKRTQRGERERDFWYGSGTIFPFFFFWEDSALALPGSTAALAWPCVASVWCNVLVDSQCASVFLSLSLSQPSLTLSWWRGCLFPSGELLPSNSNELSPGLLLLFSPFLSFLFSYVFNACRLHPLPCTMAKAGTRTERELSLACLYPKSCFFVSPLLSTFSFFSLSFQTHTKRKNKAMRIGVPVCVCTFRDFRVRGGHLKPFPSPKKTNIK